MIKRPKKTLKKLRIRLVKKNKTNPQIYINQKYKEYRLLSKRIIKESIKLLNKIKKHPELKEAQFVFLERDATPFSYVFKEISKKEGFLKEQVKTILTSKKLIEEYYTLAKKNKKIPEKVHLIESLNETQLQNIIKEINKNLTHEMLSFEEQKTIKKINPKKPIVLIDTGNYGSTLKITELMIKSIFPNARVYTALINKKESVNKNTTTFTNNVYSQKSNNIESTPKFVDRLESIQVNDNKLVLKRTNDNKDPKNTINAEIFSIALKNQILRYLNEKT